MRFARLGLAVGSVLMFAAGAAGAQDPPSSDAVDPWVTTPPASAAAQPSADSQDPWRSEEVIAPKDTKTLKKLPGPKPVKRVIVPVRPLRKGQLAPVAEGVPVAWFPGFLRLQGGGTRVFLELNNKVEVSEHRAAGRLVYRLKGVVTPDRTNRFPLLTGWIPTPVERIQLVEAGPDTDLVIELRDGTPSEFRILDTPRGAVLQVDFPPSARLKERETGENGMPVAPERARLKTTSTRIEANSSAF